MKYDYSSYEKVPNSKFFLQFLFIDDLKELANKHPLYKTMLLEEKIFFQISILQKTFFSPKVYNLFFFRQLNQEEINLFIKYLRKCKNIKEAENTDFHTLLSVSKP